MTDNECSHDVDDNICSRGPMIQNMREFYKMKSGMSAPGKPEGVVKELGDLLGVNTELQILNHPEFKRFAGRGVDIEKQERFLPKGPKNTTALLDNFNIDDTLEQLARKYNRNSNHKFKFYHCPFQMIDFEKTKSELSRLSIKSLYEEGYNSFGCVLNTDVSTGPGKHWFCIFWDGSGAGTKEDPWVMEYFNSSGNYPREPVHDWIYSKIAEASRELNKKMVLCIATKYQIQNDRHSCGVYCLAYIYYRLHGKPRGWFIEEGLDDKDMLEFRKKLFREE